MPRFVILDREGNTVVIELGLHQLEAKRGVLEALAADDGDNEIRLGDVGLDTLSAAEFAHAVRIAFTTTPWDELKSVLALRGSAREMALLEAVAWIGAESSARIATAARRTAEAPPDDNVVAQRVAGFDRARAAEMKAPLQSVFRDKPAGALLGVLVGGSLVARAARGERLQWAVVEASYHGDVDALRYLWHLRTTVGLRLWFGDTPPEGEGRSAGPVEGIWAARRLNGGRHRLQSVLSAAALGGSVEAMQFLLSLRDSQGVVLNPAAHDSEAFRAAASGGHVEALRFLWSLRESHGVAIDPTAERNGAFRDAARGGHLEALQFLWSLRESHGLAIDPTTENNEAFREAMCGGYADVMRFLWSLRGSSRVAIDLAAANNHAFQTAAEKGHVDALQFICSLRKMHYIPEFPLRMSVAFLAAARSGRDDVMRFLWSLGESPGLHVDPTQEKNEAFREAASYGRLEAVRFLWSLRELHGVAIDPTAENNEAFRFAARGYRRSDVLRFLWSLREKHGVAIDPSANNSEAFCAAVRNGDMEMLRFLWSLRESHGVPIDPTARRYEAFRSAACSRNLEMLQFLWSLPSEAGAVGDPGTWFREAFSFAASAGRKEVVRFLWSLRDSPRVKAPEQWAILSAKCCARPRRDTQLHTFEPSFRERTTFRDVAERNDVETMRYLWPLRETHGLLADPTAADNEAFRAAAKRGHVDILRFLWSLRELHGVAIDPSAWNDEAFRSAAAGGHVEALRFLWSLRESHGVAIDPTVRKNEAFRSAAQAGHVEALRFLWSLRESHGVAVDPAAENNEAFRAAAGGGHVEALRFLWSLRESHGVAIDPFATDPSRAAPSGFFLEDELVPRALSDCILNSHVEAARFLWGVLDSTRAAPRCVTGVEWWVGDSAQRTEWPLRRTQRTTLFEQAAEKGDVAVLGFLWELHERHGVDVDPKGLTVARLQSNPTHGYVALTSAARGNHRPALEFLAQLHREGKVVIDDDDLVDALRVVEVSDRVELQTLLVPGNEDASAEASRLVEELSSDASVERRLAALGRVRALATAVTSRESVAVVAEVVAALAASTQAESSEVREASWLVLDALSASATAPAELGDSRVFLAELGRELDSASPAVRARGFRILSRVVGVARGREPWELRWDRVVEQEGDGWKRRAIAGLLDESLEVQREAVVAAAELRVDLRPMPGEDQRRALGVLSHHISRGTTRERTAALVVLIEWASPGGETMLFEVEGLFRGLLEHSESMPRAVACVLERVWLTVNGQPRDTPLLTPSALRDVEATLLPRLRGSTPIDARLSAVEVLSVLARSQRSAKLLGSIESLVPLCVGVIEDTTLPVRCRARGAGLLDILASEPTVCERLLRSSGLLHTLRHLIDTIGGNDDSEADFVRAVEAMLFGRGGAPLPETTLVEAVEVILSFLGRPRPDSRWCLLVLARLSRLEAHQAPMVRVPGLVAALLANLSEPEASLALEHLARLPASRLVLAETPGLQARLTETLFGGRGNDELALVVFRLWSDPATRERVVGNRALIDALIRVIQRREHPAPAASDRGGSRPLATDPRNPVTETLWLLLDDNAALVELVRSRASASKLNVLEGQWREAETSGQCASFRPARNPRGWQSVRDAEVVETPCRCVCM